MTSASPRRRPTIQAKWLSVALLAGLCLASFGFAADGPSARSRRSTERKTLLQKLRERSAVKRWEQETQKTDNRSGRFGRIGYSNPDRAGGQSQESPAPARAFSEKDGYDANSAESFRIEPEPPVDLVPASTASSVTVIQAAPPEPEAVQPDAAKPPERQVPLDLEVPEIMPPQEPERDPGLLPKVTKILPYRDYSPEYDTGIDPTVCPDGKESEECPEEVPLSRGPFAGREFEESVFQWEASNIFYNPLYFQDVELERYGHLRGHLLQPFVSTAKFGVQLVGLPYQMTINPVRKKMYPLGYYRYGDCQIPKKNYRIPWNTKAAVVETGVWTGLFYIFP